jgi:hypothetical protein
LVQYTASPHKLRRHNKNPENCYRPSKLKVDVNDAFKMMNSLKENCFIFVLIRFLNKNMKLQTSTAETV